MDIFGTPWAPKGNQGPTRINSFYLHIQVYHQDTTPGCSSLPPAWFRLSLLSGLLCQSCLPSVSVSSPLPFEGALRTSLSNCTTVQVAATYASLVPLLQMQNRQAEALAYSEKALHIKDRALPPSHPEIAYACLSHAVLLRDGCRCPTPSYHRVVHSISNCSHSIYNSYSCGVHELASCQS